MKFEGVSTGGGLIESSIPEVEGQVALKFYEKENRPDRSHEAGAVAVLQKSENGELVGKVNTFSAGTETWGGESRSYSAEYLVSFDSSRIKAQGTLDGAVQDKCLARNSFNSKVYSYGLYNGDGSRVDLNSGFSIEFDTNEGIRSGHASYWGLWTEGDVQLSNGQQVRRVDWVNGQKQTSNYTVVESPGKLVKYSASTITLSELQGVDLSYWDNETEEDFVVQFNGQTFEKVSKRVRQNNGPDTFQDASGTVSANNWGSYSFYANSLSAQLEFSKDDFDSQGASLAVKYHKQEIVSGTANVPSGDLVCVAECLKIPLVENDITGTNEHGPYYTTTIEWDFDNDNVVDETETTRWPENIATAIATYSYDSTNHVLELASDGTDFSLPSISRDQAGNWTHLSTGILIPQAAYDGLADKANLNPWDVKQQLTEYYQWETGFDDWNRFRSVEDANGSLAQFDKPIRLSYTHSQANDYDNNPNQPANNKKYELEYGGFGELWGIPWNQIPGKDDWEPEFSIRSGVTIGNYVIKALSVAQVPAAVDLGECSLDFNDMPTKPNSDDLQPVDNGTRPDDSLLPTSVIGGIIQNQ